jgi:hypothetical protein
VPDRQLAQQYRSDRPDEQDRGPKPNRRLDSQREIKCDTAAEQRRNPQDAAVALGGESGGDTAEGTAAEWSRRFKPFIRRRYFRHRLSFSGKATGSVYRVIVERQASPVVKRLLRRRVARTDNGILKKLAGNTRMVGQSSAQAV